MKQPHQYQVYGLILGSNRKLPGLREDSDMDRPADLLVNLGSLPNGLEAPSDRTGEPYYFVPGVEESDPPHLVVTRVADGDSYRFQYEGRIDFLVYRSGSEVWGIWKPETAMDEVFLYLLGPVLGFILRLRGVTCLHAGGVVSEGNALALAGASGAGKSTLVAACAAAGCAVLTDDVMPLELSHNTVRAIPGCQRLRLYPKSLGVLGEPTRELPRVTPDWNKRYLSPADGPLSFHPDPAPLKAIYLLDWSDLGSSEITISPVSPSAAVPWLAATTYRNELLDSEMRKDEFLFLTRLVSAVTVRRVQAINDVAAVSRLCKLILDDFHQELGTGTD